MDKKSKLPIIIACCISGISIALIVLFVCGVFNNNNTQPVNDMITTIEIDEEATESSSEEDEEYTSPKRINSVYSGTSNKHDD